MLSLRQLAHEMNNRLDGAMRWLRLAAEALESEGDEQTHDTARRRLASALDGMDDLALMLQRTMQTSQPEVHLLGANRTLGEEVERLVRDLEPLASRHGVTLTVDIDPAMAMLPAGPLGAVLENAIRNGIEAAAGEARPLRRVEASISLDAVHDTMVLLVSDSGPGVSPDHRTKPGGHGLGLTVCRKIVAELGGSLLLTNVPFGGGTVMRVTIPTGEDETS